MYRSERPDKGTILYVGGLDESVKKEEIEKEFEKFGKLSRVWVAFNPPGFAFVEYENKDDAENAVGAMHSAMMFGSRLRVEISRGRGGGGGRGGGRGGSRGRGDESSFSSRGRGGFRGGRGDFGGRGSDFGRGRGRGGYGRGSPYDRSEPMKSFRDEMGFDDFLDRRRPDYGAARDYGERGFGNVRDSYGAARDSFGSVRDSFGTARDGFESARGYRDDDLSRGYDIVGRDFSTRDYSGRDFPVRDAPERDFARRDYGAERPVNGAARAAYGNLDPIDRGFGGGEGREFGASGQSSLGSRDFGSMPVARREAGGYVDARDYGADRDIGMRRDSVRDFNPPRDLGNLRDYSARPSRIDYADDRYGAADRGGFAEQRAAGAGFASARFAGGDVGDSGDYGGFGGARDRYRSRSPIGRGSRPLY